MTARVSPFVYWVVYVALVLWLVASGLHFVRTSLWVPVFFMMVLDGVAFRRGDLWLYLSAFLMSGIAAIFILTAAGFMEQPLPRAVLDTACIAAACAAYQAWLWRQKWARR